MDEIRIKPGIRYRANHLIGQSVDQPDKAARAVLAFMIAPLLGVPAFIARLIPVYTLDADLLLEQLLKVIQIIHQCKGFVFLTMCDNLRANQRMYRLLREQYGCDNDFPIHHPVQNSEFPSLHILYDPTHLFKSIRKNWVTEKMKTLDFTHPCLGISVSAKWSHLVDIFEEELKCPIKLTKLTYASLYPTNFEKQKVSLAMNIFNEKTVTALGIENYNDTKVK